MKELISIIDELHAPKNKVNSFGKFNYRDAAGVLEAVKPLLIKYNCLLLPATSEVKQVGDRYYLYCTVGIRNSEGKEAFATAPAREQDNKSGMDAAQLTGACISYAKKYALCSLFGIDDSTDDPDTDESTKKQKETSNKPAEATKVPRVSNPTTQQPKAQQTEENKPQGELKDAIEAIRSASTPNEANAAFKKYEAYKSHPLFAAAVQDKKEQFKPKK